jgi:predicted Kef-type K+ transport protein
VHVQVGMSLAQIGEFAFVLLSRASNLHLVEVSVTVSVCHADT